MDSKIKADPDFESNDVPSDVAIASEKVEFILPDDLPCHNSTNDTSDSRAGVDIVIKEEIDENETLDSSKSSSTIERTFAGGNGKRRVSIRRRLSSRGVNLGQSKECREVPASDENALSSNALQSLKESALRTEPVPSSDANVACHNQRQDVNLEVFVNSNNANSSAKLSLKRSRKTCDDSKDSESADKGSNATITCSYCGARFRMADNVKADISVPAGRICYECPECDKLVVKRVQGGEKRDVSVNHGEKLAVDQTVGERPHDDLASSLAAKRTQGVETLCDKRFYSTSDLEFPKETHTAGKSYRCKVCGKQYVQKIALSRHQQVHSGLPTHQCTVCGKMYLYHTALMRHKETHSEERSFNCSMCDKNFFHQVALDGHMHIHSR